MAKPYGLHANLSDYGTNQVEVPLYAAPEPAAFFQRGSRRRINSVAIVVNIFLPWFVAAAVLAATSFALSRKQRAAVWSVVSAFLLALLVLCLAFRTCRKERTPTWYGFASVATILACLSSALLGELNFRLNMQPYYDIGNLNSYPSVDPNFDKGKQLMDVGTAYFVEGARLDLRKAMAFKNLDLYCVTPIVRGEEPIASYDFWAVGINCCSGVASNFHCGEFSNPLARSGLRLMNQEVLPFFRLAVQQAEAAYGIKAVHPLFFHWMQDPVAAVNRHRDAGLRFFMVGVLCYFGFNLFCVLCAVIAFTRIGHC